MKFQLNGRQISEYPNPESDLRIEVQQLSEEGIANRYETDQHGIESGQLRFVGPAVRINVIHITDEEEQPAFISFYPQFSFKFTQEQLAGLDLTSAGVYDVGGGESAAYMGGRWQDDELWFRTMHWSDYAVMEYTHPFIDMAQHWAAEEARLLAARHVTNGVGDQLFAPDRIMSRAEYVTMLMRVWIWRMGDFAVEGISFTKGFKFPDVPHDAYYAFLVKRAYDIGVVDSKDGIFRPDDPITREEATVMAMNLYRAIEEEKYGRYGVEPSSGETVADLTDPAPFRDMHDVSPENLDDVIAAWRYGLIEGYDGLLSPQRTMTRAEMAVLIARLMRLQAI